MNSVKNKKSRIIMYGLLALFVLIIMGLFFGAEQLGRLGAYYDLMKGHYEIRTYGLHIPFVFKVQAKNLEDHGIAYQKVAGCVVNDFVVKSVRGYNGVMKEAIKGYMGIDVDKLLEENSYEEGKDNSPEHMFKESNGSNNILVTRKPYQTEGTLYKISHCFDSLQSNLDLDNEFETVCLRILKFKDYCDTFPYTSFVVEVLKNGKRVLIQELDRTFYYEERFFFLKGVDQDSRAELITHVTFGPECIGCDAYRIYQFNDGWPEIIIFVEPPYDDFYARPQGKYYLFIVQFNDDGDGFSYRLLEMDINCCGKFFDILGFITTENKRHHLLINHADVGTSTGLPVLNVFDVQPNKIIKIGEFGGFYEHRIPMRIVDVDYDGNSDIIYVKDVHWPTGKPHADVIIDYGIAKFVDGIYMETGDDYVLPINIACQ